MAGTAEAERFRTALAMADLGVRLRRQQLRRHRPEASDADIDAELRAWLHGRPMDAPGSPRIVSEPSDGG